MENVFPQVGLPTQHSKNPKPLQLAALHAYVPLHHVPENVETAHGRLRKSGDSTNYSPEVFMEPPEEKPMCRPSCQNFTNMPVVMYAMAEHLRGQERFTPDL